MLLFHGSNVIVAKPRILTPPRALDFGAAFYTTSDNKQAAGWARLVCLRKRIGAPVVNAYSLDVAAFHALRVLRFEKADSRWLDFVVKNRTNCGENHDFDLIAGPVADDTTIRVINFFMDGVFTKEEAVKRLLTERLTDQFAFCTEKSLRFLHFNGSTTS